MRAVVHLRGSNACGKSTVVRQFVKRYEMKPKQIVVDGIPTWIEQNEKYAAVGRYKPHTQGEGCDAGIKNKEHLKNTLRTILEERLYELVLFEGVIYGITFKLSSEINQLSKAYGYEYHAVNLVLPYTEQLNRLMQRNKGNAEINIDSVDLKIEQSIKSAKKLYKYGIKTKFIDTSKIREDEMWKVVWGAVDEKADG